MSAVPAPPGTVRASADAKPGRPGARWFTPWAGVTLAAALAATVFDAILLQYRRAYFTGGFLATDYVTSLAEAFLFLAGSLITDAAVIGVVVWIAVWVCGRLGVPRYLTLALAFVCAIAPVLLVDFIEYQLLTYLGDAFDLRLLFDLAGRDPGELIAVSSSHVAQVIWLVVGAGIVAALVSWIALRRFATRGAITIAPPPWRSLLIPLALCLAGTIAMTSLRASSDVMDNGLRRKPTGGFLGPLVQAATDVDRDGYGALARPADPDLFDANVRPYALDEPGNGIDEDGVGGDLPSTAAPYREAQGGSATWAFKSDVVLVVLESFRADARGAHIEGKPVTPVLDALAGQGIAPTLAYSHNGYTVQSRRHIFSGSVADIRGRDTLIDDFKKQGYEVAYFSGQDESFGGAAQGIGFDRADVAYDARQDRDRRYSNFSTAGSLAVPYGVVQERIAAFLEKRDRNRPLFLYVNFHDTHFPYHHRTIQPLVSAIVLDQSEIAPDRTADLRAMYMNTAANVDRAIGGVLSDVRQALGHDPGVIVMSDHGESLFDEGFLGHGYTLNDAQTRIPLVVANLPLTLEEPFAQADLRDAIDAALKSADAQGKPPVVSTNVSRRVFQYLGLIERPAQIAWTGSTNSIAYDFREGTVRVGHEAWRRPEDLDAAQRSDFISLIQTWERMMLARRAASSTR
ncbi:MAG: sulfatase-like hydrolase/transferase [Acidobacteria bacterium]|nr:sulfatase-like hydrolase/transferase [Acidobacteriota bacterium]